MAAAAWAAPVRWEPAAGGNGHLYEAVAVGSPTSWDNARAAAKARGPGWDLATITSAGENAFVKSLFETKPALIRDFTRCGDPDICWYRIGPWIGGFNVTELRQFQWVTGEPVTFTDWGIHTFGPQGQQIAYLKRYFSFGSSFAWSEPNALYAPVAYVAELTTEWASLLLKQSTVPGCRGAMATVVISQPAPPEGLVVNLSDTLEAAISPATLRILPGAKSGNFTIRTMPVAASETGTVSAAIGSIKLSQQLTVRPMGVQHLTLSEPTVVGGSSLTGRATLECTATAGPITVDLTSSNPAVASPVAASIVVPQGMRSETFDITTRAVLNESSVSITGRVNGIRKSKLLKVTPSALASPTSVKFGDVIIGTTSAARNVTLYNKGAVSFSVTGVELTGSNAHYFGKRNACPAQLAAGASCTIGVTYSPTMLGTRGATLSIATTARNTPLSVWMTGTGVTTP
jgi:hypothetical protein